MSAIKWLKTEELPEPTRRMLAAFEDAFCISNSGYSVTHVRSDAVFVCFMGWCNPYQVAKFIQNNPTIYIEIQARARNHIEFRMFGSEWMQRTELPRMKSIASKPARATAVPASIRIQAEALKDYQHYDAQNVLIDNVSVA